MKKIKYVWDSTYYEVVILDGLEMVEVKIFYNDFEFERWMAANENLTVDVRRISRLVFCQEV